MTDDRGVEVAPDRMGADSAGQRDTDKLPEVVRVADAGLHPWVRAEVSQSERLAALHEELEWSLTTAITDLEFGREFAAAQPSSGQPAQAFLNRWIAVTSDLAVLAGPRYRGRDPQKPFVAVDASSRLITAGDTAALRSVLAESFAPFTPRYVRVWTCHPPGHWPGTRHDMRNVAGGLGDLRRNPVPPGLTARPPASLHCYDRYTQIHRDQVAEHPEHAVHARLETREDLAELLAAGTLFEVVLHGRWVGVVAAEPGLQHGLRGAVTVELLLDPSARRQGYGRHLSTLLAQQLQAPDAQFLLGTIHLDNAPAYRSAIAAGRRDVGGEVILPLSAD